MFVTALGLQGWRSGEGTRLPPMWPGFDCQIRRQIWVEFVGSLLCTERFSPGTPVSPLLPAGLFCRLQVAGCRLKFHYNWKTADTKKKHTSVRLTVTDT